MTVYIDNDYKCHAEAAEGLIAVEVPFFDGKCKRFIEGYRYVPDGETWVREDGVEFTGEMIAPHVDYALLAAYQEQYAESLAEMQDMQTALNTLGVSIDG